METKKVGHLKSSSTPTPLLIPASYLRCWCWCCLEKMKKKQTFNKFLYSYIYILERNISHTYVLLLLFDTGEFLDWTKSSKTKNKNYQHLCWFIIFSLWFTWVICFIPYNFRKTTTLVVFGLLNQALSKILIFFCTFKANWLHWSCQQIFEPRLGDSLGDSWRGWWWRFGGVCC